MAVDKPVTKKELKEELIPIIEKMGEMSKILTGNGTNIGMDENVRNNTRDIIKNQQDIEDLKKLYKDLQPIISFSKVGIWMAGVFGAILIGFFWAMLTGQIVLEYVH